MPILLVLSSLIVAACSNTSPPAPAPTAVSNESRPLHAQSTVDLPDLGPAPELMNEVWLNVDAPLRLADLSGRVVLLDFWTFG